MNPFSRIVSELRRRHANADVERALDSLVVIREAYDVATIVRAPERQQQPAEDAIVDSTHGTPLFYRDHKAASLVRLAPRVYAETPTTDARVRLLRRAASFATNHVEVHAPTITGDGTYMGRLAFDVPRRIASRLGLTVAEPGDRFARTTDNAADTTADHFLHAFFDDEQLIAEAELAGLSFVSRQGAVVVLDVDAQPTIERPLDPFRTELRRVLEIVKLAENERRTHTPEVAIATMRALGRDASARGPKARARLRRAVGWIDAVYLKPNCFRRTLIEIGLDAGAASETLVFGLDVGKTGHVAFKDAEDRTFDVVFEIA